MKKHKEKIGMVLALFALALVTIGISYAAFTYIGQGQRENTITTGNLTFAYDESNKSGNGISIDNATPTSDDLGKVSVKQGEVFEFSVSASTKGSPIYYEIYVAKQSNSTLPERVVKTYLTELQGTEEVEVLDTLNNQAINFYNKLGISQVPNQENGRTLYQEMIPEGQSNYSKTFRYRMWIDGNATDTNKKGIWKYSNMSFTVKVSVYASNDSIPRPIEPYQAPEYVDNTKANEPVLLQGQIPVVYDREKESWVKQDIDLSYAYQDQIWANVVTVTEENRNRYMGSPVGTTISMDDINTMWVWIPRYEYMYTNLGTAYAGGTKEQPGEIKVNFVTGSTVAVSDSANYKMHPAFTFGEDEVEGIWYAKFETSTTDATCNSSPSEANCNKLMTSLQVKPNVSSWRYANISNMFHSARNMQLQYASTYGFEADDSDLHMSKNSEWGSVAYLSQSKYGKYGNPDYEGIDKEIYQNKSSSYITGSSNGTPSTDSTNTQVSYDVEGSGTGASTTGNITGIYDMSGGANEYVMGYLTIASSTWGATSSSNYAGFTSKPEDKYFDGYTSTNSTTACNGEVCYGHALSETASWYSDYAIFLNSSFPWFRRGGYADDSAVAGMFLTAYSNGSVVNRYSSRLVQAPFN